MLPWHVPPAMRTMAFALVVLIVTEKDIAVVPPYAGNVLFGSKGELLFAPARVTTATSTYAAPGTFTVMLYVPALAATAYATNTQLLRHPFPTLTLCLVVDEKEGLDETEGLGVPAISTSAITTSNSLEPCVVIDTGVGGLVKEPEKTDESTVIANLYSPHTGIPTMLGAAV